MIPDFSGQPVWITGGLGFLGTALVLELMKRDAQVTVIDPLHPACGGRLRHADEVVSARWIRADIGEAEAWAPGLTEPRWVFNLAAHISHVGSERDPELDLELNVRAQQRFLRYLARTEGRPRVVYASTRQIYGETSIPAREGTAAAPPDWNGVHKLAAEEYHALLHRRDLIDAVSLRLPNIYGPRMPVDEKGKGCFVGWLARNVFKGEPIELIDGGILERNVLEVSDAVLALLHASGKLPSQPYWNVDGEVTTVREVAETLVKVAGRGTVVNTEMSNSERRVRLSSALMDGTAFRGVTGWRPQVTLAQGLGALLRYIESNPSVCEKELRP